MSVLQQPPVRLPRQRDSVSSIQKSLALEIGPELKMTHQAAITEQPDEFQSCPRAQEATAYPSHRPAVARPVNRMRGSYLSCSSAARLAWWSAHQKRAMSSSWSAGACCLCVRISAQPASQALTCIDNRR